MADNLEAQAGMMPPGQHMPMVAPTFMQRLCQLLHKKVTVFLNCEEATAPLTGTLHAVGQDYIELVNGPTNQTQATIIPLKNICSVNAAGAMDDVCPPPEPYPYPPQYPVSPGQDMMPGCPMPGPGPMPGCPMPGPGPMPGCPKPGCPMPGSGHDCPSMQPPGWGSPGPGFMDVKKEEEEK